MSYKLFLDDERFPNDAFYCWNSMQGRYKQIYNTTDWVIVRSYNEFVEYITKNGLPSLVTFDHDLADEHYCYSTNIPYDKFQEKTGYDCAKWLCDYIMDNNLTKFPDYLVHTMNDVGAENIVKYVENFKRVVLNY